MGYFRFFPCVLLSAPAGKTSRCFFFCRYIVLGEEPVLKKDKFLGTRPIWFIYTGVGCQWPTMGRDLLKFDIFKNTFHRCAEALIPYGLDLYDIVTSDDPTVLEDIRHSFTAICAVQVALTDVLKSLGISPDGIAGYSMGEVGKQKFRRNNNTYR